VSGIGCSSRIPGYTTAYGFNTVHGRALPIAQGIKLANPSLLVLVAGGDGDGFSIGGGHVAHAIRRNLDLTYIIMDNQIYGLTKGQLSPTSPKGLKTASSTYGSMEDSVNPLLYVLGYGCRFVAQGTPADMAGLAKVIEEGIRFPGFAFINVQSPCVTYGQADQQLKSQKAMMVSLEAAGHDPANRLRAMELAQDYGTKLYTGVLYRDPSGSPPYEVHAKARQDAMAPGRCRASASSSSSCRSRRASRRLADRRHLHGGGTTRVNCPRCSSSRPATAGRDFVLGGAHGLQGAAARLHRQQVAIAGGGDEPEHAVVSPDLHEDDALARPGEQVDLADGQSRARASRVTAIIVSVPWIRATPTTSAPSAGRAYRRPARVDGVAKGSSEKRRL